jgi:hypothetical protein
MVGRIHDDYYAYDLLSDLLGRGKSARLKEHWVKENPMFSQINAYISGDEDPGMLVIQGNLLDHVDWEDAEKAIYQDLQLLCNELISEYDLEKIKNQFETAHAFAHLDTPSISLILLHTSSLSVLINYFQNISPMSLENLLIIQLTSVILFILFYLFCLSILYEYKLLRIYYCKCVTVITFSIITLLLNNSLMLFSTVNTLTGTPPHYLICFSLFADAMALKHTH